MNKLLEELRKKAQIALQQLERERDEARARLALVEPALRVARAFIDESRWRPGFYRGEPPYCGDCGTKQGGVHLADCGEEHAVRTIDAALDAAPPSSEPTKPPADTGNHNSSQIVNATPSPSLEVPPLPGELCKCGRPAITVFLDLMLKAVDQPIIDYSFFEKGRDK